jgi:hypothetical protein
MSAYLGQTGAWKVTWPVRKQIRYVPDDIVIDLSEPDLGHPDALDILQRHYRQSERPSMGFSQVNPAFICLDHEGGTNPGLFLQKRNGEWWARHYEKGACRSHRLPAPMSDEHKRQTEYWTRAAEDVGWRVELEHTLHTGTRPDALIHGRVTTGIEVQRSSMTASRSVARTGKAASAGVTDLWYSDWTTPPRWAWRVPTVLPRELGIDAGRADFAWKTLPPRRAVAAAGLRVLRTVKCTMTNFSRCPYGRNWCGKYHPRPVPWGGLAVDDVAARFPAGEIVPLRFWGVTMPGSRRRDAVFLVSPADFDTYEEITGWSGAVAFQPEAEDRPPREPSSAADCRNPQPLAWREKGIWGIDPQTPMWCDCCESRHPIIEHRKCRAAAQDEDS